MVGCVFYIIGVIGIGLVYNIGILLLFRIELGIVVGGVLVIVFLYLLEMVFVVIRGRIVLLNILMNFFGIFMVYIVNFVFLFFGRWDLMFLLVVIFFFIFMVGMFFMFESL